MYIMIDPSFTVQEVAVGGAGTCTVGPEHEQRTDTINHARAHHKAKRLLTSPTWYTPELKETEALLELSISPIQKDTQELVWDDDQELAWDQQW